MPLTDVVVEDVQATTRPGQKRKWNASFSPVQVGKEHLYHILRAMGLTVHTRQGWQTKELRLGVGSLREWSNETDLHMLVPCRRF